MLFNNLKIILIITVRENSSVIYVKTNMPIQHVSLINKRHEIIRLVIAKDKFLVARLLLSDERSDRLVMTDIARQITPLTSI